MRVVQIDPGPDADLHRIGSVVSQRLRARGRRDVAADDLYLRVALLDPLNAVEHPLRVPVRSVDDDDVDARADQRLDTFLGVAAGADGGARAQPAVLILRRTRVLGRLEDVLDGDQAAQLALGIEDQHALEPMPVHQFLGRLELGAFRNGHQPVGWCHDVGDRLVEIDFEAQVAVGDDPDDLPAGNDRQPRDPMLLRQGEDLAHRHRRRDRDRILDHPAFEALHLRDFGGLPGRRHVLVDDAQPAFLRDGDGKAGFGHRVHRRRQERHVEGDRAGQAGRERDVAGNDQRMGGNEKYVVERQRLADDTHSFSCAQKWIIPVQPARPSRSAQRGVGRAVTTCRNRDSQARPAPPGPPAD